VQQYFLGVIILESLTDPAFMDRVEVLRASDVRAPAGDPYSVWRRRLVRVPAGEIETLATKLASLMREDFYNHFVDDTRLVVVFKGKYFVLDKRDKSTWTEMIRYGETVRVGPRWTTSIPVDEDKLL
jgi:hypothetical protein